MVPQASRRTTRSRGRRAAAQPARLTRVIAIIGGLGAAMLWAAATLCSSRSSRMLGSRVVLGWVMVVGVIVGLPIAVVSPGPATLEPSTLGLLGLAGICYVIGLQLTYAALRIGKVSIVAPIVATEGAVAALIAVAARRHARRSSPALMLAVIASASSSSTLEPGRADVPAGDFDVVADAIDGPDARDRPADHADRGRSATDVDDPPRARPLSIVAALVFGLGLVAAGKAAALVPVAWVAAGARGSSASSWSSSRSSLQRRFAAHPRGAAARPDRRHRGGLRLDALGVGLARQHRDHRRDGQPVRGDRRGRRVLPVRRAARSPPGRRRRAHRRRRHGAGRPSTA